MDNRFFPDIAKRDITARAAGHLMLCHALEKSSPARAVQKIYFHLDKEHKSF